jgi:hypothetical protein
VHAIPGIQAEAGTFHTRHDDIVRCVESQTRIERLLPKLIIGSCCGAVVLYLAAAGAVAAIYLIGITFALLVAKILTSIVQASVLEPIRNHRYKAAANQLAWRLDSANELALPACSWFAGAPGALGLSRDGRLLLVCRSSGYEELHLSSRQVADVRVNRNVAAFTSTSHSGHRIYGSSDSLLGAYVTGGRSTSITRVLESASLRIAYQLEINAAVLSIEIPFKDADLAENLCALIRRMQPRPITSNPNLL